MFYDYDFMIITTVSLVANTYCMMDGFSSCASRAVGPRRVHRGINDWPVHAQDAICYQWFKQQLILSVSKPSISQWSQTNTTPSNPLRLPDILFSEYALCWLAWTNKLPGPDLNSRPSGPDSHAGHAHCSAVVYTTEQWRQATATRQT